MSKASLRVDAYGSLDELSAQLGVARSNEGVDDEVASLIVGIQRALFWLCADVARTGSAERYGRVEEAAITELEGAIDRLDGELGPLTGFVLAGGRAASAQLHLARTVCRRAERALVALAGQEEVDEVALRYINRLSDLLFCLARITNHRAGTPDTLAK